MTYIQTDIQTDRHTDKVIHRGAPLLKKVTRNEADFVENLRYILEGNSIFTI